MRRIFVVVLVAACGCAHDDGPKPAPAPLNGVPRTESYALTDNYPGSPCKPRGEVTSLSGKLGVEPFGKGTDGAVLVTAEGERWILSYRAEGPLLDLAGRAVTLRGRACDKELQGVMGKHFDASTVTPN